MEKSFARAVQVSIAIHLFILASFSAGKKTVVSIPFNIEFIRIKPSEPERLPEVKKEDFAKKKKEDKTEKKEEKPQEDRPELIRASSKMLIEAKEFPFTYYLKILQNKIMQKRYGGCAGNRLARR